MLNNSKRHPFRMAIKRGDAWEIVELSVRKNRALRKWRKMRASLGETKFLQPKEEA